MDYITRAEKETTVTESDWITLPHRMSLVKHIIIPKNLDFGDKPLYHFTVVLDEMEIEAIVKKYGK